MTKFKALTILGVFTLFCGNLFAQTVQNEPSQDPVVPYRLFRTTNIWTFIQLDTITGRMWQIQFDIDGDARGAVILNSQNLASGKETIIGRFTLFPTSNMWTFILLDQFDGSTWQVQWSHQSANRLVLPIN